MGRSLSLLLFLLCFICCVCGVSFKKIRKNPQVEGRTTKNILYGTTMVYAAFVRVGYMHALVQLDTGSAATTIQLRGCQGTDHNNNNTCGPAPGVDLLSSPCAWGGCTTACAMAGRCAVFPSRGSCCSARLRYADTDNAYGPIVALPLIPSSSSSSSQGEININTGLVRIVGTTQRQGLEGIDGLMGLALPSLSPLSGSDVLSTLGFSRMSFCGDTNGGNAVFSDDHVQLLQAAIPGTPLQKEPLLKDNSGLYLVQLQDMRFSGAPGSVVSSGGVSALVDTGTTLLMLPAEMIQSLHDQLVNLSPDTRGIDDLFNMKCVANIPRDTFPDLVLKLGGGTQLHISAMHYIIENVNSEGGACFTLGIYPFSRVILGDVALSPFVTVFDRPDWSVWFALANLTACRPPSPTSATLPATLGPYLPIALNQWNPISFVLTNGVEGYITHWDLLQGNATISPDVPSDSTGSINQFVMANALGEVVLLVTAQDGSTARISLSVEEVASVTFERMAVILTALGSSVFMLALYITSYVIQVRDHATMLLHQQELFMDNLATLDENNSFFNNPNDDTSSTTDAATFEGEDDL